MKVKRLIPAIFVTFIFAFVYEWLLHGIFLKGLYQSTPQLWRPKEVMPHFFLYLIAGQFLTVLFVGILFSKGYENRGIGEGARFGFLMGLIFAPSNLVWYAIEPLPGILIFSWMLGGLFEMLIGGILLAAICRPKNI